jgi:hypothetical protein
MGFILKPRVGLDSSPAEAVLADLVNTAARAPGRFRVIDNSNFRWPGFEINGYCYLSE